MQPPKSNEDDKEEVPSKSQIDIKDFDKVEIKAQLLLMQKMHRNQINY